MAASVRRATMAALNLVECVAYVGAQLQAK